ncbi:hypothetical protein F4774DRAFT_294036 [Daldinia eschscholtzii]|nr:hypothetical protein F4774DRAFT_294036 [Daldinia eschscholtzii]
MHHLTLAWRGPPSLTRPIQARQRRCFPPKETSKMFQIAAGHGLAWVCLNAKAHQRRPMTRKIPKPPHTNPCPSSNLFPLWASMQPTQANRPAENSQNGPQSIPILGNLLALTSPFSIYLYYVVYLPTCRARRYRRFPPRADASQPSILIVTNASHGHGRNPPCPFFLVV